MTEPKVIVEQRILDGGDGYRLQPFATIYLGKDEYRAYAPPKATGNPLEWIVQMHIRRYTGGSEYEVQDPRRGEVIDAISKKMQESAQRNEPVLDELYCEAQICTNGDVQSADGFPFDGTKHCTKCGAECISACVSCRTPIRGKVKFSAADYECPSFCHSCGKPYPWMDEKLRTAKQFLYHDDKLTPEDRKELWELLQYVMSNPKAELTPAKSRLISFKIEKATQPIREFVLDLMAKYGAEMSK
jgi:hypothetical protein